MAKPQIVAANRSTTEVSENEEACRLIERGKSGKLSDVDQQRV